MKRETRWGPSQHVPEFNRTRMYNKLTPDLLQRLVAIVGPGDVLSDRERMEDYSHDESSLRDIHRYPDAVVKPEAMEEVAAVLRLADSCR